MQILRNGWNGHEKFRRWGKSVASQTELSKESVLENFYVQQGYATPKIDVRGAVIRNGKVLLVQEKADGKWSMPGGWVMWANCHPKWWNVKFGKKADLQ